MGKSQILFLVVFVTRYLDLLTSFISLYNTTMKIFFIGSAAATVYLMYQKFKATHGGNHDTFRVEFLLGPALLLSLILNRIYRYYGEGFYDIIAIVAGCVQTILYCDFFYLYITKVLKGKKLQLPA